MLACCSAGLPKGAVRGLGFTLRQESGVLSPPLMKFSKGHFLYKIKLYGNYQTHDCSINGLDHTTIQAYNCQTQSLAQQSFVSLGLSQS